MNSNLARISTGSPMKRRRFFTVVILLFLTVALLLWHHWGMNRYLLIDPSRFSASAVTEPVDDGDAQHSQSQVVVKQNAWHVSCEIVNSRDSPYCGLDLLFKPEAQGLDLSPFDRVQIRYRYPHAGGHLRISLFNYSPEFSRVDDYLSSKVEEAILLSAPDWHEPTFLMSNFNIPTWWIVQRGARPDEAGDEFNRIVQIRIATGYDVSMGKHQFAVEWIQFSGKWISAAYLRLLLLFMWLGAGAMSLIWEWRSDVSQLRRSRKRQQWLENTNLMLTQETQLLADRVRIDPLTKARNREGLADFLAHHSQNQPISLIFFDLDHFKKVNDTHGHGVGDVVLQHFASWVSQQIRPEDCLVRWGGEEFLLISIKTNLAGAAGLAEKIRASLAQTAWPNQLVVTCSAGVAEMAENEAFASVMERADAALYQAKAAGRNRIEIAVFCPEKAEKPNT